MTVGEIIKRVKWCIDHETREEAALADGGEDTYMDNIIRAKITDALRWVAMAASQQPLMGESMGTQAAAGSWTTMKLEAKRSTMVEGVDDVVELTMPDYMEVVGVSRVRLKGWHKAAVPVEDTSDDALMMYDETARGTVDRPLATIVRETPVRILAQPMTDNGSVEATVTYVGAQKSAEGSEDTTEIAISGRLENAFIYYIAYLLLAACEDAGAQTMLSVAMQNLGYNTAK